MNLVITSELHEIIKCIRLSQNNSGKNKLKKGSFSYLLILKPFQDAIKTCFQPRIMLLELTLAKALILAKCLT